MIRFEQSRSVVMVALVLCLGIASASAECTGDCNSDGKVDVGELLTMVNIDLESAPFGKCMPGDVNGDNAISVDEIVTAAHNLLAGCPANLSPTPTPTFGPLGTRHFVLNPSKSAFEAVLSATVHINLGGFQGQTANGDTEPAFLDLQAETPDPVTGVATLNVVNASPYIFASNQMFGITICLRPIVPATAAGAVGCKGGFPFGFQTNINHQIGQVGVDITVAQCESTCEGPSDCGHVESPNQICAAGFVGFPGCRTNADCDSTMGAGDGVCGLGPATCTAPPAQTRACQSDADCDSGACKIGGASCTKDADCGANGPCEPASPPRADGVCGNPEPHPGVCNGPLTVGLLGGDTGPGEVIIAPNSQFDLGGLPIELLIENAPPCGDEGPGQQITFALTSGMSKSTITNAGATTGSTLTFSERGQNFSCADWQDTGGPGRLVLTAPALHLSPTGGDLVTGFVFDGSPNPPTPTPTHTPNK